MKKKILAFGGSNSSKSINKILASYVAGQIQNADIHIADLNDYALPLYSMDLESDQGIPDHAHAFAKLIENTDGIVLSLAEHNGLPTTVFKNLIDWLSRIDQKIWKNKPMILLATSPGARGGASVLGIMKNLLPFAGAHLVADFSLPSFYDHFSEEGIKEESLRNDLSEKIKAFELELNK